MNSTLTTLLLADAVQKYSPDQARDDHGRFGEGSGGSSKDIPNAPKAYHEALTRAGYKNNESYKQSNGQMLHRYDKTTDKGIAGQAHHTVFVQPGGKGKGKFDQPWQHITVHQHQNWMGGGSKVASTKGGASGDAKSLAAHLSNLPLKHS